MADGGRGRQPRTSGKHGVVQDILFEIQSGGRDDDMNQWWSGGTSGSSSKLSFDCVPGLFEIRSGGRDDGIVFRRIPNGLLDRLGNDEDDRLH
ncbi:hypothetical protein L1887_25250 [Cichorium endivia]|nr:hypothetical protein L1887_25250 [Cichorium endivia]